MYQETSSDLLKPTLLLILHMSMVDLSLKVEILVMMVSVVILRVYLKELQDNLDLYLELREVELQIHKRDLELIMQAMLPLVELLLQILTRD